MRGAEKNGPINVPVNLSLLDKLAVRGRKGEVREPLTPEESMRRFKESVRENLEWVLNTRRSVVKVEGKELSTSVFYFGLRDLTGISLVSENSLAELQKDIQIAVRQFEPRIQDLRITMPKASSRQWLTFQIEGRLVIEHMRQFVSFRTILDMTRQRCEVLEKPRA